MKKIISILLTAAMLLALGATLASCGHECEFSDEWSNDEESHWHACEGKKCEEVEDKDDHEWDEGKVTTPPTKEADGVMTYTCKVCGYDKTEKITVLSKEEWDAAFEASLFENFKYSETATTTGSGVSVNTETVYKFTKNKAWYKMTVGQNSQEDTTSNMSEITTARNQLVDSIKDMTPYDSFEYDAETKTYKASKPIKIASLNASTSDIALKFDGTKLVEIKYEISFKQSGISFNATSTITLSDYGTVVIN